MVDEVDDISVRVQGEGRVRGVPAGYGFVDLCGQWFETVRSLKVERDEPVGCEWRVRLEGPEEGDEDSSNISGVLPGSPSKREGLMCVEEKTYKSSLSYYPLILLDYVRGVIHRVGVQKVPLFKDRGHVIKGGSWFLHEDLGNTSQHEVGLVIKQFERFEQIVNGTVLPENGIAGWFKYQGNDEILQSDVHLIVLVCSFLEVLIGQNNVLVDNWLQVCRGEKLVVHWRKDFSHCPGVCESVNPGVCTLLISGWEIMKDRGKYELVGHHKDP